MTATEPAPDTADLLLLAEEVAREAGRLIVERRPASLRVSSKSTDTDPVTEMDQASERLLVERIRAVRPDDGFLGEEGAAVEGTSGVTWVMDPIDGTVNYLYSIPAYAVSVGVRYDSEVVAGAVVNPVTDEVWTARRGHGARLNGEPIVVNPAPDLAMALIATGFGYDAARRARQADVLRQLVPQIRDVRRAGSAALDLCGVACGRVDGYYEVGLNPWDLAAGGLIATEAGAIVQGLRGRAAGEGMVVAAPPGLFEPLEQLLAGLDADQV
ncbi:MAG: inositol monophosphatase family protein [Actinomycetes bacterium]